MKREGSSPTEDGKGPAPACPVITTAFSGYNPPRDVVALVRRMLDSVPDKHLTGLSEIVLTNAGTLPRSRRRSVTKSRGRKVRVRETRGLYHPAFHRRAAWIEIFVDNTLRRSSSGFWKFIPIVRMFELREVLFHEIGHHIHHTTRPEYREKEDVADVWKVRLEGEYNRRRFPWLRRFARLPIIGGWIDRWQLKVTTRMYESGAISRGEYEESIGKKNREGAPNRS